MSDKYKHSHLPFTELEEKLVKELEKKRDRVNKKFPLWTALAATFGVVVIWYGTTKLIDQLPFFVNNPWTLIFIGVFVLVATGSTYKKL